MRVDRTTQMVSTDKLDFAQNARGNIAEMSVEQLNRLTDVEQLINAENLFKANKVVILGENHFGQHGLRYMNQNWDFLCNRRNEVLILDEGYPCDASKDAILQVNSVPAICAAMRRGAKVRGIETAPLAKIRFKYQLIESQVKGKSANNLLAISKQIAIAFQTDFGENMEPAVLESQKRVKNLLAAYDGKDDGKRLTHCFDEIFNLIHKLELPVFEQRMEANADFCAIVQKNVDRYKNILVIVGAAHAIDQPGYPSLKTMLNGIQPDLAQAYCFNDEDVFSNCEDFFGKPTLCLPGRKFPEVAPYDTHLGSNRRCTIL